MKIRAKLTFLYAVLTVTILLFFAAIVYYSASKSRESEFFTLLEREAVTKGNLYLNAQVETKTLQDIYNNNREMLNEVEVAIYNAQYELLYHDAVELDFVKETPQMLNSILEAGHLRFYQEDWQVVGLRYDHNGGTFLITAAAYDLYGYNKLDSLFKTILIVAGCSLLLIFFAGKYFSDQAFKPVRDMTAKMKLISATNLGLRINHPQKKDELSSLSETFDGMLDRLEKSFESQKQFVSFISHEIRTPLSAIIAELELSKEKNLDPVHFEEMVDRTLLDARRLVRLSNSLLDLAKASLDPSEITFKPIRVDELLMEVIQQLKHYEPGYQVTLAYQNEPEEENELMVSGNSYLLSVAFLNLMENGCKFSRDQKSQVGLIASNGQLTVTFSDKGIGIAPQDLKHIFQPFFRGTNSRKVDGNGIGLTLTKKIIELHKGSISVQSEVGKGTTFVFTLPHI